MTNEDYEILIKFINKTIQSQYNTDSILGLVGSLWIVLFLLILLQKFIKYVVKPRMRNIQQQQ